MDAIGGADWDYEVDTWYEVFDTDASCGLHTTSPTNGYGAAIIVQHGAAMKTSTSRSTYTRTGTNHKLGALNSQDDDDIGNTCVLKKTLTKVDKSKTFEAFPQMDRQDTRAGEHIISRQGMEGYRALSEM